MKRFIFAGVAALAIGLGTASTADAQYVYRTYNTTPYGGVVVNSGISNGFAFQGNRTYVSPFGYSQRNYYGDAFGNQFGTVNRYNYLNNSFYNGYGYNSGVYLPSPFVYPSTGFGNGGFYRRW